MFIINYYYFYIIIYEYNVRTWINMSYVHVLVYTIQWNLYLSNMDASQLW